MPHPDLPSVTSRVRLLGLAFAALVIGLPPAQAGDSETPEPAAVVRPLIDRGAQILLEMQESLSGAEAPGEWPYEGVYRTGGRIPIGYRVGGTAIGAWALLETAGDAPDAARDAALARALDFVLAGLDDPLMQPGFDGTYDVRGWGHLYALNLMLRLRAGERVPTERRQAVDARVTWLVDTLQADEIPVTGGWNYSRRAGFDEPGPASAFMTAPTLMALFEAARQGESVDPAVIDRALLALSASRTADGAIPYSVRPGAGDEMPGAIGRTPVSEVVLHLAGRGDMGRIRASVEAFFEHWEWLEKRRRQTGTHVPPYGVAPYYFYYAHYYAALAIEQLPEDERPPLRGRLLGRLLQVQEESGGWNDRVFPRSENYGTAMSILALAQPGSPHPTAWRWPEGYQAGQAIVPPEPPDSR